MRILLTVPSLRREFGGPVGKTLSLRSAMAHLGHRVRIVTVGGDSTAGIVAIQRLGSFRGTPVPRSLRRLSRAADGAEVIHALGYRDPLGTAAALLARRAGVPYLVEPMGMHRRRVRSLHLKAAFDATLGHLVVVGASRVVATSELEASELAADGIPDSQLVVRADGVDLDGLLPLPERGRLRARLGIPSWAPLVVALARLTAKKRLTDLVRAVAGLEEVWLLVAGPDPGDGTLCRLRKLRESLTGERLVLVPGGLWGQEKARALAEADVFAVPSATENFGIAAAEAACCGLPVVVSEACGVKEWLDPGSSRIVGVGQIGELQTALRELLADPSCPGQARRAAGRLRQQLAWGSLAARQVEIYGSVLESGR